MHDRFTCVTQPRDLSSPKGQEKLQLIVMALMQRFRAPYRVASIIVHVGCFETVSGEKKTLKSLRKFCLKRLFNPN